MQPKTRRLIVLLVVVAVLMALTTGLTLAKDSTLNPFAPQAPVGTGFTYQGQLTDGGSPASGSFDLQFELYDAETDGSLIGTVALEDVAVTDGLFTVTLDFGSSAFDDSARWLAISVRLGVETGAYTPLSPRQPLTAAPYAQYALEAGSVAWKNVSANPIPGSCAAGEILAWNDILGSWECVPNTDTTYTAGFGLELDGTTFSVLTNTIQTRVIGTCFPGSMVSAVNADGSVQCQMDAPLNRPKAPTNINTMTIDSTGDVGQYSSITIGTDGMPIISYYDTTNGGLKAVHCNDIACGNATTTPIDTAGYSGFYSSIAIGSDDLPVISYHDPINGVLKVAHCNDVACDTSSIEVVDEPSDPDFDDVGMFSSITIGSDGLPVISYQDNTESTEAMKVAHCLNITCSNVQINSFPEHIYTSIIIGTDGLPIISYVSSSLNVYHCDNIACSTASGHALDSSVSISYYTSITIGADGLPIVSYYDSTNGHLKVAHCNDPICNSATNATVDSTGTIGQYSSITVGANGLALISYYDVSNGDLKVAHCNDLACSSTSTTTLDTLGDVGQYTSITIGVDGLPVISYYDVTNGDLKVIHCSNAFCTPYFRRR